ncbi:16S rRNA (cytidine(1402)-2'-O)-methyltransferase [Patescibacteria group bacterium]|nr:16S rRNA (cytidine(1402)-2'-O)-methyltransferase [Patescibacteria group bacterium]
MLIPKFYVVATPIGNLEDITLRALRVLKEVDVILCEDTRVTTKLLKKYNISTPLLSYHRRSGLLKVEKIFKLLDQGKNLALVSDAGTPTISDPGSFLVSQIRKRFKNSLEIIAIPGASALSAALSISGVSSSEFLFLGFLPHKKGRQTLFKEMVASKRTVVFYESPHRILKTLESLMQVLAANHMTSRVIIIARELTKIYEEVLSGTAIELLEFFEAHKEKQKGEFVIILKAK